MERNKVFQNCIFRLDFYRWIVGEDHDDGGLFIYSYAFSIELAKFNSFFHTQLFSSPLVNFYIYIFRVAGGIMVLNGDLREFKTRWT